MLNHILLLVSNDPHMMYLLKELFPDEFDILLTQNKEETLLIMQNKKPDILLFHFNMSRQDGFRYLHEIREYSFDIPIYVIASRFSMSDAVQAMKYGINDFINEPLDLEELRQMIFLKINESTVAIPSKVSDKLLENKIVAESKEMMLIWELVQKVAHTDANVLITGETGTGKEVIARAIHNESKRAQKPFVPVNCAAIPDNLLESEMFGYEEGAFTGAHRSKTGRFELANNGTILLDEIGDMSLITQAKMLRVLEERVIERLGGTKSIPVDVRIISSTNKNLHESVKRGEFREDLYYRLAVFPIYIPPLRNRKEDIPALARHFLKIYTEKYHRTDIIDFDSILLETMKEYKWPGNARELRNIVEQLVILSEGPIIQCEELSTTLETFRHNIIPQQIPLVTLKDNLDEVERQTIINFLRVYNGNRTKTAEILGISRRSLQMKIKKYGI